MHRIAMFLPNWVGDVVMATPAIRAVREYFPDAKLVAVCRPYVADVLGGCPWFDRVILAGKEILAPVRALRRERIDGAVLFPNSFRPALVARLAGCRRSVGYSRYGRSPLLTDRLHRDTDRPSPVIHEYNRLVEKLGVPSPGYRMELFTTPADESAADAVLGPRRSEVVGLNPGAAFGAAKHWPADHFVTLARTLAEKRGSRVVVLCGPKERELARDIATRAGVEHLADAPLSLGLTKAITRRLDLLVTTDSGPRHFAAAFGRPVVALFGPTHIEWTQTYFVLERQLQRKVPCGPCQLRVCPTDHRCMRDLAPADVFAACESLLTPGARHAG